mgnify:CR=1 FL=1
MLTRSIYVHTLVFYKLIYKAKKLVNWDTVLKTAISDLEVDQREVNSKLYHIKEWFVMTQTESEYTLIVQMCVKSREGILPREAGTIGQIFSF